MKPRPSGKAKGTYAKVAKGLSAQKQQISGSSADKPQHHIMLENLNAGILRVRVQISCCERAHSLAQGKFNAGLADKADLGMFYSKAEYQDLEKAAAARPHQVRQTRKVNANMRRKMTQKVSQIANEHLDARLCLD